MAPRKRIVEMGERPRVVERVLSAAVGMRGAEIGPVGGGVLGAKEGYFEKREWGDAGGARRA